VTIRKSPGERRRADHEIVGTHGDPATRELSSEAGVCARTDEIEGDDGNRREQRLDHRFGSYLPFGSTQARDPVEEFGCGDGGHRNASVAPPLEERTENYSPAFDIDQVRAITQIGG